MPLALPASNFFSEVATNGDAPGSLDDMLRELRQRSSRANYTISSGIIVPTTARVRVVPETGSADNLDQISPSSVYDGMEITVSTNATGDVVTVRHGQLTGDGRIETADAGNIELDDPKKKVRFRLDGGVWEEVGARTGFPVTGGGGGGDTGEVDVASAKTTGFTASAAEVNKITPVDTSGGNVTVTFAPGLATPAGKNLQMFFKKTSASNTLSFAAAGGGDGSTPVLSATFDDGESSGNSATALAGTEAGFTTGYDFVVPAGDDCCLFVDVFANFKDTGSRTFTLQVNGADVTWTNSAEHTLADDAPCVYHYRLPLGDLGSNSTKNLKIKPASVATGLRAFSLVARACTGVHQTTPTENIDIAYEVSGTTSSTRSVVTTGANRRVFYCAAQKRNTTATASLTGATQTAAFLAGTATNTSNIAGAYGHEAAATAGTYDATHQFTLSQRWARVNYAVRPTAGGGGITVKTPGNVAANITAINKMVAALYDGNGNVVELCF